MKNFEDMCNRLGTIPACDRRTDGHLASYHGIECSMHTRRAVKMKSCIGQTAYSVENFIGAQGRFYVGAGGAAPPPKYWPAPPNILVPTAKIRVLKI